MKVKGSRGGQGRKRGRVHHPEPEHPSPRTLKAVWFSYRQLAAWTALKMKLYSSSLPNTKYLWQENQRGDTAVLGHQGRLITPASHDLFNLSCCYSKKKKHVHAIHGAHMYSCWKLSNTEHAVLAYAVLGLREFWVYGNLERRDQFSKEKNLHFMGSLNRKGGVSSWFSLKRSVIKPLPYNQYTNTSAGCVWCSGISIWAWGRNVVCVCFLLSYWISYRAESHGTDGTKDACWSTTGIK